MKEQQKLNPEFIPPKLQLANRLREMMETADGNEKCTLCKAAEELEKSCSSQWDSKWMMLIMALIFGFGSPSMDSVDPQLLKACMGITGEESSDERAADER